MRERIYIVSITVIVILLGIYSAYHTYHYRYELAEEKSIEALEEFSNLYEHGDLIVDSDDVRKVVDVVINEFGEYFTEELSEEVENDIREAMANEKSFAEEPAQVTFFLSNSGDGFRFIKNRVGRRLYWLVENNRIRGTEIFLYLNTDIPGWPHRWENQKTVVMEKQGWKWKIKQFN